MNTVQLIASPGPGQTNSLGFGSVSFSAPNAPVVNPGDVWVLQCQGEAPNLANIGVKMPWDPPTSFGAYEGATDASGNITMAGVATGPGNVATGLGIVICVGLYPGNFPNPFPGGYRPCSYLPQAAAPPAAAPGLPLLIAQIENSWNTHVAVADSIINYAPVTFLSTAPWQAPGAPPLATVYPDISASAAAAVALLLGGSVAKLEPPNFASLYPFAVAPPLINYIKAPINGQMMQANAFQLIQSFNNRQAGLESAILACFTPVAS